MHHSISEQKASLSPRGQVKTQSTCCCVSEHRGGVAPVRDPEQLNVIDCGVHQVRHGHVTGLGRQSQLQCVRLLLGVTDPDHKAIEVARHCAPGQAQVVWARRGSSKGPQLGGIL